MLAGLLLLESLSIGLFAFLLVRQQTREIDERAQRRLAYEANSLALQVSEALQRGQPGWVGLSVKMLGNSPTVAQAGLPIRTAICSSSPRERPTNRSSSQRSAPRLIRSGKINQMLHL